MFWFLHYEQLLHYSELAALFSGTAAFRVSPGVVSVWASFSWGCGRGAPGNASAWGSRGQKTLKVRTERTMRLTAVTQTCSMTCSRQRLIMMRCIHSTMLTKMFIFSSWRTTSVYFWLLTISRDLPYLLQMLFKFNHAYTSVDVRLLFYTYSLPFMLKQDTETLWDT